jgi:AbrB family looped-hinge helix DNA binding protein
MKTVTVSAKGRIVIPKELRIKYGLHKGAKVHIVDDAGVLSIVPLPEDPIDALYGMLASGPSLTADLAAERQNELVREERLLKRLRS